jgi:hypothetical protein
MQLVLHTAGFNKNICICLTYCHMYVYLCTCTYTYVFTYVCIYRVIYKSFRDVRHLRFSRRDVHAEGEHVNRGRGTQNFCPTLQVLDMSFLLWLSSLLRSRVRSSGGTYELPCICIYVYMYVAYMYLYCCMCEFMDVCIYICTYTSVCKFIYMYVSICAIRYDVNTIENL